MLATQTHPGLRFVRKVAVARAGDCVTKRVKARPVSNSDAQTLQGFVHGASSADTQVFTDDRNRCHDTFYQLSERHSRRYDKGLADTRNDRDADTPVPTDNLARDLEGKRLRYSDLVG